MKKQFVVLSISLTLLTYGVMAQGGHTAHKEQQKEETIRQDTDPELQKQLGAVYKASLDLNEALVASDAQKVKNSIKPLQEAIAKVDAEFLKDKRHLDHLKEINVNLKAIQDSGNIADQRKHYSGFSDALYKIVKAFGIEGEKVYYQHCPMALNNLGAYWLSDSKEIRNPYFGSKMLTCGSVKETIN